MINPYIEEARRLKILFKNQIESLCKYANKKYTLCIIDITETSYVFIFFDMNEQKPITYAPGIGPRIKLFCEECYKKYYKVNLTDRYKEIYPIDTNIVYFEYVK
jgi:hypothetical protein